MRAKAIQQCEASESLAKEEVPTELFHLIKSFSLGDLEAFRTLCWEID